MGTMNIAGGKTARRFFSHFLGATVALSLFGGCGRKEELVITKTGAPLYSVAPENIDGSDGAPAGELVRGERYAVRGIYSRKDFLVYRVEQTLTDQASGDKEGFVIFDGRFMAVEPPTGMR